ncbi:MAG: M24 family metallopeptidase [Pseudomonadota bacterium]
MTGTGLFDRGEYEARLTRARAAMAAAGIDALVVTDPSNMHWLTGYDGWSFYVHQAAILGPDGEPLLWLRTQDMAGAYQTAFVARENVLTYPEAHVQNPDAHPYETLATILAERGLAEHGRAGAGRLGVEMDNYYFSAACLETLRAALPGTEIADATGLVNRARLVKSPAEIAAMRTAGQITARMHDVLRETARAGIRKCDLVAEVAAAGIRGLPEAGGDYPAIVPIAPSGREASASHITWNDRPMVRGEATYFEISGCFRRYHCPASRTLFLGSPPAEIRRGEETVLAAIEDALATARPGATCEAVAEAVYAAFRARGFEKGNRTGYPIGLSYPPDWGERTVSLRPGDETVLEEGMCFHLMPGLWTPDWGLAITESFEVTPAGGAPLAEIPRPIAVID